VIDTYNIFFGVEPDLISSKLIFYESVISSPVITIPSCVNPEPFARL
jgi:hypothetical protein